MTVFFPFLSSPCATCRFAVLMSLLSLGLTACSITDMEETGARPQNIIFVQGDPKLLLAGSKGNTESPITPENLKEWNSYRITDINKFVERRTVVIDPKRNILSENGPRDRTEQAAKVSAKVEVMQVGASQMIALRVNTFGLLLEKDRNGRLQPTRYITKTTDDPIQVIHWSQSNDGKYLSLLFHLGDDDGKGNLVALYFEKPAIRKLIDQVASAYFYLAGPGKKIGWNESARKNFSLQLCGADALLEPAKKAVDLWNEALQKRMNLTFSVSRDYPPFSDLNTHCVYSVRTYLMEPAPTDVTFAATIPGLSFDQAEIYEGDIFFYEAEYQKIKTLSYTYSSLRDRVAKAPRRTMLHEIGHLLGLDHQFTGVQSIMSYDFNNEPKLYPYDIEAIQRLYQ